MRRKNRTRRFAPPRTGSDVSYFLFGFLLDAGRFAWCPAHRASAIFFACSLRFLGGVLSHRFCTSWTAAASGFSFRDMIRLYTYVSTKQRRFFFLTCLRKQWIIQLGVRRKENVERTRFDPAVHRARRTDEPATSHQRRRLGPAAAVAATTTS